MSAFFKSGKFTGFHMSLVMVLFFGTIITVNLTLAYFANSTWTGLVVKSSYIASQTFDKETDRRNAQIALGWNAEAKYGNGLFSVLIVDAEGKPVDARKVVAKFGRPVTEVDDRTTVLYADTNGRYSGKEELGAGLWQVDLSVEHGQGETWNHAFRFTVKH